MTDNPPNPTSPPIEPGALVGPYRVAGVLADGPSGTVYEAVESASSRRVALRHLPGPVADDAQALEQIQTGAGVWLRHPNIVAADGIERHGGDAFLVMEFVGSRTAAAGGRMPWRVASRVVRDAARGLAAIHEAGLAHRNLKPTHLLIDHDGTVKVADLGLPPADTGRPDFRAPEQFRGESGDARSDLYSLGAVYFALLAGRPPFAGRTPADTIDGHLHQSVPTVRTGAPDIPLRCDSIIQRAMAKEPAARYPTAEALVADLDALLATDDTHRPLMLPKLPPRPRPWVQRAPLVVGSIAAVAALAAATWYVLVPHAVAPTKPSTPASASTALPTVTNSAGMVLARVPTGLFRMGDPLIADAPPHPVQVSKPFLVGVHEVTQAQYRLVVGDNPSQFHGDNRPVESVTWPEAVAFCEKLSALGPERAAARIYRLPTEAEWEYACRAGTGAPFCSGRTLEATSANLALSGYGATTPVGTYPASPWGLFDVHGNVWEWCADWYAEDYYAIGPAIDPPGPEMGTRRVTRGGSWQTLPPDCRSAFRNDTFAPDARSPAVGFRVVCVVDGGK